jgi:hypothetical protein
VGIDDASTGRGTKALGLLFFVRHLGLHLEEDLPPPKDVLPHIWERSEKFQVLITTTIWVLWSERNGANSG